MRYDWNSMGQPTFAVGRLRFIASWLSLACLVAACHDKKPSGTKAAARPTSIIAPEPAARASKLSHENEAPDEEAQDAKSMAPLPSPALRERPHFQGELPWGIGADAAGTHGVVTSVERSATRVGVSVLEAGGNAIDAAVATALALAVTHPSAGNLGGGGFLLLRHGDQVEAIDFREDSPQTLSVEAFWKMIAGGGHGPFSVGVPGTVAGLYLAHQRHGRLPWEDVVRPAEKLASDGYELGQRQAQTIVWAWAKLATSPVAREVFFDDGKPKRQGARITRPRLALALRRIREQGAKGFYQGPTAADLVASVQGALDLDDLRDYRARLREPLFFDFGPYRIITMPPPSGGGVALTAQLRMLDALSIEQTKSESARRVHLIAEASRRAQAERHLFVVAPDAAGERGAEIMRSRALSADTWLKEHPVEPNRSSRSRALHPAYEKLAQESEQTTHLSVIDENGDLVSCTLTLSASYGSYIFSKETGIVLNNSAASFAAAGKNTPAPGQRTVSSMAPSLAFLGDNVLVLGSPGGDTIPSTVTQVFLRLALDGESLITAVRKPRFHQGFVPEQLGMERSAPLSPSVQNQLVALGHEVKPLRYAQGDANIAAWVDGSAYAVFDRREGGLALAAQPRDEGPSKSPKEAQ